MNSLDIAAYEPIYQSGQSISDSSLMPLNCQTNTHVEWRELAYYIHTYRAGLYLDSKLTGILSPKFFLKTGVTPTAFLNFARSNLDVDVIYINPFPHIPYFSYNVWMQGEVAHPGVTQLAEDLLFAVGLPWRLSEVLRQPPDVVCYSNFWLGTPAFWRNYVGGVLLKIAKYLENNKEKPLVRKVLKTTTHTDPTPYLPFIIERLFSTYISLHTKVKRASWQFTSDEIKQRCVNEYERILFDGMSARVRVADISPVFPKNLMEEMQLHCRLWQQQFWDYFSNHQHPHTNRTISFPEK